MVFYENMWEPEKVAKFQDRKSGEFRESTYNS